MSRTLLVLAAPLMTGMLDCGHLPVTLSGCTTPMNVGTDQIWQVQILDDTGGRPASRASATTSDDEVLFVLPPQLGDEPSTVRLRAASTGNARVVVRAWYSESDSDSYESSVDIVVVDETPGEVDDCVTELLGT